MQHTYNIKLMARLGSMKASSALIVRTRMT